MALSSDKFKIVDIRNYPQLTGVYETLAKFAYNGVNLVLLPDGKIGLCCELEVDAGTSTLLKFREPVIIEVSPFDPENATPVAYPDRMDFPFEKLPHINYPKNGMPPSICLTREDADEWYSEITFRQFIVTLVNWLDDAANDRLIKLNVKDEYEPFRVPDNAIWHIFRSDLVDGLAGKHTGNATSYFDTELLDERFLAQMFSSEPEFDKDAVCVHLFKSSAIIERDWYVETPASISALISILVKRGYRLDIDKLVYILQEHSNIKRVFLSFSVIRPTRVLGKESKVDTLCYTFESKTFIARDFSSSVEPVTIIDMVTPKYAGWLSKTTDAVRKKKILIIGVGAVGSAIADLLYRNGLCKLTLCDNDGFSPHNVVRHIIPEKLTLKSKVQLMERHLKKILFFSGSVKTIDEDAAEYIKREEAKEFDLIIDASASSRVMYALDDYCPNKVVVRVCMSNSGKVGMLYIHRKNETKLHEFYYQIMRKALDDGQTAQDISSWLKFERSSTLDRIRIGEGCHSNTMQMGYNKVIPHCGLAVSVIKDLDNLNGDNLYLNFFDYDYEGSLYTERFCVSRFVNVDSDNLDWQIRIPEDLLNEILKEARNNSRVETGGYLIGLTNAKRKTIYVLATFIPADSNHLPDSLVLGTEGWKDYLSYCNNRSAGQLRYLGDWHSHPHGSVVRSQKDKETFDKIRPELDEIGVCLITNMRNHKAYIIGN